MKTITVESRQQTVEVEFVLHFEDLAEAERLRRQRIRRAEGRHRRLALLAGLAGLLLLAAAVLAWLDHAASPLLLAAVLVTGVATVTLAVGPWWLRRSESRALAARTNPGVVKQRWVASAVGLTRTQGGAVTELPWSSLRRVQRLGTAVALYVDDLHYHVIPDRAFVTEKQQLRFLRMAKANIAHHRG